MAPVTAPITAPLGVGLMASGGALNRIGAAAEVGVDLLQVWNNDFDTQGGSAYTNAVNFVIGEGFEALVNKVVPGAGESTKPLRDELIKRLLPEGASRLQGEINKKENGEYKPVNP